MITEHDLIVRFGKLLASWMPFHSISCHTWFLHPYHIRSGRIQRTFYLWIVMVRIENFLDLLLSTNVTLTLTIRCTVVVVTTCGLLRLSFRRRNKRAGKLSDRWVLGAWNPFSNPIRFSGIQKIDFVFIRV